MKAVGSRCFGNAFRQWPIQIELVVILLRTSLLMALSRNKQREQTTKRKYERLYIKDYRGLKIVCQQFSRLLH